VKPVAASADVPNAVRTSSVLLFKVARKMASAGALSNKMNVQAVTTSRDGHCESSTHLQAATLASQRTPVVIRIAPPIAVATDLDVNKSTVTSDIRLHSTVSERLRAESPPVLLCEGAFSSSAGPAESLRTTGICCERLSSHKSAHYFDSC
jgi:hypothetical protein